MAKGTDGRTRTRGRSEVTGGRTASQGRLEERTGATAAHVEKELNKASDAGKEGSGEVG